MADYLQRSDGLGSALSTYLNLYATRKAPSVADSIMSDSTEVVAPTIVAVVEGKRSLEGMIGVASINLETLEIRLAQFRDPLNYSITKEYIKSLEPDKVIYPGYERKNIIDANPRLTSGSSTITVEPCDVNYFNEKEGHERLTKLGKNFIPRDLGFSYTLPVVAVSACFNYVLLWCNTAKFSDNCLDVVIEHRKGYLTMDLTTVKTLEILASADCGDHTRSLFWLLNRTYTRRGMRIMKANLLQPPAERDVIVKRQDAVEELVRRDSMMNDLGKALSAFSSIDMDFTLRTIVVKNKTPNSNKANLYIESLVDTAVYLREVLVHVENLVEVLQDLHSPLFQSIHSQLSSDQPIYDSLVARIRRFISDSCTVTKGNINFKTSKLFAINPEADPFLDIKLKTYSEHVENLTSLASTLSRAYSRPVRINYQTTRGYHFILPIAENEREEGFNLPEVFLCPQRKGNNIYVTTKSLMDIESSLRRVEKDIYKLAGEAVIQLIEDVSKHVGPVSSLFENIGTIDFIRTLALVAVENKFVRPKIGNHLEGRNVINPLLLLKEKDKSLAPRVVPNPIPKLSGDDVSMLLLTGANRSGKSCYLSTVALLQIMAQIGSFVPVERDDISIESENSQLDGRDAVKTKGNLVVPVVDQIFTRMGMDDDYTSSSSSFLREVAQISYIAERATKNSLVIIDELGRGTSVEEGVSFCFAVAEKLLKTKCITLIASHFHDLIKLECLYPNIVCYEMEHRKEQEGANVKLIFTHRAVVMGDQHFTEYGIDTAESMCSHKDIIASARHIVRTIQTLSPEITLEAQRRREMYKLHLAIMKIAETDWSSNRVAISEFVQGAQRQYLRAILELTPSLRDSN